MQNVTNFSRKKGEYEAFFENNLDNGPKKNNMTYIQSYIFAVILDCSKTS